MTDNQPGNGRDRPHLDPADDIATQLWDLVAWGDDRLADETYNRQVVAEELLTALATLAERADTAMAPDLALWQAMAGLPGQEIATVLAGGGR